MKIGFIGFGKMGQAIAPIAEERGHLVAAKATRSEELGQVNNCDVVIDFSVPDAAVENLAHCRKYQIPHVIGTTGWNDQLELVTEATVEAEHKLLWAANFSVGVNLFFVLNQKLAALMNQQNYNASIEETHHTEKLDAPSGTAIHLAKDLIAQNEAYQDWQCYEESCGENIPDEQGGKLGILARRIPGVKGLHKIFYNSEIDTIEITHQAHSRRGFALGAVIAAEWLQENQNSGVYTMADVLKI